MCSPISPLLAFIFCCGTRPVQRTFVIPAPSPVFHVQTRGPVPFVRTVPGYNAHAVPGYRPPAGAPPFFGGRVQEGHLGRTVYAGPVVTPASTQQAPGLHNRVNVRAPHPAGVPPKAQVGTRR